MTTFLEVGRAVMAVIVLISVPGAILVWLVIHPAADFWRRRGPVVTYMTVASLGVGLGVVLYQRRDSLLGEVLPFDPWLAGVGLAFYGIAIWLELLCRRHLKLRTLVGLPEVGSDPSRLLDQGIYARIRHPRYVSFTFGVLGWAMILNYRGLYYVLLAALPLLLLVVWLEERELRSRFGDEYVAYMQRVPRFFPRLRAG